MFDNYYAGGVKIVNPEKRKIFGLVAVSVAYLST